MKSTDKAAIPFVDLARSHDPIREEIDAALASVVDAGAFILGPDVEAFEREWADVLRGRARDRSQFRYLGHRSRAGGARRRARRRGHRPLADVHRLGAARAEAGRHACARRLRSGDGNDRPDAVAAALSPRTKAIIAVHLYGQPADMDALQEIADSAGIALIEDAAQAHGARYRGRRVGSLGRAACFSFYPSKNLGALGDGGAVVTSDPELAERVRILRDLGQVRKYEHVVAGHNDRLDTLHAAVLRRKLPHLDEWNASRRAAAAAYGEVLADLDLDLPIEGGGAGARLAPLRRPLL